MLLPIKPLVLNQPIIVLHYQAIQISRDTMKVYLLVNLSNQFTVAVFSSTQTLRDLGRLKAFHHEYYKFCTISIVTKEKMTKLFKNASFQKWHTLFFSLLPK